MLSVSICGSFQLQFVPTVDGRRVRQKLNTEPYRHVDCISARFRIPPHPIMVILAKTNPVGYIIAKVGTGLLALDVVTFNISPTGY
jgi:hypothetical protein